MSSPNKRQQDMINIRQMAIKSGDPASFYNSLSNLDQYKNSDYLDGIVADLYPQGQRTQSPYEGLGAMGAFKGRGKVGKWWNDAVSQNKPAPYTSPYQPQGGPSRQVTDPLGISSQDGIAAGLNLSNIGGASPNMMGEELRYGVNPTITSDLYQNPFDYQAEPMPMLNTSAGTTMPSVTPTVSTVPNVSAAAGITDLSGMEVNPNNSILDRTHIDESSMFGDIGDAWGEMEAKDQFQLGAGVAMAGLQGYNAWQANEIAEDKLDFQMDAFNKNFGMQQTAYNDNIQAKNRTLASATGSDQYAHNKV